MIFKKNEIEEKNEFSKENDDSSKVSSKYPFNFNAVPQLSVFHSPILHFNNLFKETMRK